MAGISSVERRALERRPRHTEWIVPIARNIALLCDLANSIHLILGKLHHGRSRIFLDILGGFGAGNGQEVGALRNNPCKRNLASRGAVSRANGLDLLDNLENLGEILFRVPVVNC